MPRPKRKPAIRHAAQQSEPQASARWTAVMERDTRFDGKFLYAVKTSGVYCRPACPSRRPKRENVIFYETSGEARRAGFRPCKRCHPE
jgi:AraC family transcriptional regulator of adaptative response/methylated-DNA-[protein]-cysteine methyltransferase